MEPRDPAYAARVAEIFRSAAFIERLGIGLVACGPGWVESRMSVPQWATQQDGFVHAGAQSTLADHTAGAAAGTLMAAEEIVLSVEFKIQLLRPARGSVLTCRAEVLRPGRRIVPVEARVTGADGKQTAHLTATMTFVGRPER
jgi:uncharacterized protein (TIGR00369 family)